MAKPPSTYPVDPSPIDAAESRPAASSITTTSPEKWAEIYFPNTPTGRLHDDAWKHAAAAQLHGWGHYAQRTGKQVLLSAKQYESAIAAVSGKHSDPKPSSDADHRSRD